MRTEYLPEPTVILFGCTSLVPLPPRATCPTCRGHIHPEHPTYYCGRCDRMNDRMEAKIRGARIGLEAETRAAAAERKTLQALDRDKGKEFPEGVRRRWWNGCNKILREQPDLVSLKPVRDWLREHGLEPNWDLVPVRNDLGRIVRWELPTPLPAAPEAAA